MLYVVHEIYCLYMLRKQTRKMSRESVKKSRYKLTFGRVALYSSKQLYRSHSHRRTRSRVMLLKLNEVLDCFLKHLKGLFLVVLQTTDAPWLRFEGGGESEKKQPGLYSC